MTSRAARCRSGRKLSARRCEASSRLVTGPAMGNTGRSVACRRHMLDEFARRPYAVVRSRRFPALRPMPISESRSGPAMPIPFATALIVGVTSHRDLDAAQLPTLRAQLADALTRLRDEFPELPLVVLSPLAEGGDRLAAEVALQLGARLVVPLPMPVDVYAEDFVSVGSHAQFEHLLAQAEIVPLPSPTDLDEL